LAVGVEAEREFSVWSRSRCRIGFCWASHDRQQAALATLDSTKGATLQALLGTRLSADINLVAQILILVGLWAGFYFARRGQIPRHQTIQTSMVLVNLFFIAFVMITSFYNFVILGGTTSGTSASLMIVHGILGLVAEATGIYLILRMRTQVIPPRLRVSNFKLLMRMTLGLWTILVVLGLGIYYFRYISPPTSVPVAAESVAEAQQAGVDLLIHAAELSESVSRDNLDTVRRHAEHLVNLIEGETGEHYGDLDGDGFLEDPGDGVGLVNYLESVASISDGEQTKSLAAEILGLLQEIDDLALSVLAANDLNSVSEPVEKVNRLAQRLNGEDIAQLLAGGPDTVIVLIDNFAFSPGVVSVPQSSTVVWINKETPKHTVTADNELFNSETMSVGESYSFTFTFNETGTFAYYCKFHGDAGGVGMIGQIEVEP
jgi:plastocyanin/uncharacterized membrane protein YozB (DUF420 family)